MDSVQALPKFMGARVKRREDPGLITGKGLFVADIQLPDTLHLAFVRSPYAHARVGEIDSSEALALPGVVAILTAADVNSSFATTLKPGFPIDGAPFSDSKMAQRYPLASSKVHFVGEPVALVLAENSYTAQDAVELVFVDYDPLAAQVDPEAALASDAAIIHEEWDSNLAFCWGPVGEDVAPIFASAAHTIELTLTNQRVIPNAMEPRAVLAQYEAASDSYTVWSTTQSPHGLRDSLAAALACPPNKMRVIAPEVGGGFGVKGGTHGEEILAPYLARRFGRPVKWAASRSEDYLVTSHGRDQKGTIGLAADETGRILAASLKLRQDCGAFYGTIAPLIPAITISMMTGVYDIPKIHAEATGVFTNKHPSEPYRGAGRPDAAFLIERAVDVLADEMGLDPAELRRRNYVPPEKFPYKTAANTTYDSGNYLPNLEKALELSDYEGWREKQRQRSKDSGKLLGVGLCTYVEVCGPGPFESGGVFMDENAKVTIKTGSSPHGQGHETTWAQIAADTLQLPMEEIEVLHGDTAIVPRGMGTYGSRSTALAGSAVRLNSQTVLEKARHVAAHLLEASPLDVTVVDSQFQVVGVPERSLSWAEVAAAATDPTLPTEQQGGLQADKDFEPEERIFPFGSHVAVVEIDKQTGALEILRYLTVDDCGRVINPMLVEGQIHGGLAQGLGQALWEVAHYDEMGNLLSGSALDYAIPRADNFPHFENHRTETPSPLNPLGVKGVGEASTIGSMPTIVNAVVDALSHLGIRHVDMPLTTEKIWSLLHPTE
eukprot:jgi/Undpi1/12103/HiC_scaffold_41.g14076.m1